MKILNASIDNDGRVTFEFDDGQLISYNSVSEFNESALALTSQLEQNRDLLIAMAFRPGDGINSLSGAIIDVHPGYAQAVIVNKPA